MEFSVEIEDVTQGGKQTSKEILQEVKDSIYMKDLRNYWSTQYLPNSDLQGSSETFPRSTLMLDNDQGLLKMYFIDRNFSLVSYCFESYIQNIINQRQYQHLDPSIVNGTCSDLKHIRMNDQKEFLIVFCLSKWRRDLDQMKSQSYLTVVQIRQFDDQKSQLLYYTQDFDDFPIDFSAPVRFISNRTDISQDQVHYSDGEYGIFLACFEPNVKNDFQKFKPQFISVNFTLFNEMTSQGQNKRYDPEGKLLSYTSKVNFTLPNQFSGYVAFIDYMSVFKNKLYLREKEYDVLFLAFIIEAQGMLLCKIRNFSQFILSEGDIGCVVNDNAFFHSDSSALSVHFDPAHPDRKLYQVSASPPKVIEYDVMSFQNSQITKIYSSKESISRRYVAMPQLAVNKNQIVLLLRDIYTNMNVIRVYSRNTTFYKVLLQDIELPQQSRSGFFDFPNYYFNKMLFRDERTVNITQYNLHRLIITRNESLMNRDQHSLIHNRTFNISISHTHGIQSPEKRYLSSFNVTFVDKFNTNIFPSTDFEDGNVNLFYSCGDNGFIHNLNSFFNGPEYRLNHKIDLGQENFFKFESSQEKLMVNVELKDIECQSSYLIPNKNMQSPEDFKMLLLCVDIEQAQLVTYRVYLHTNDDSRDIYSPQNVVLDNNITMPYSKLLTYQYDYLQDLIIAVVELDSQSMMDFQQTAIEIHYFKIDQTIQWKNKHCLEEFKNFSFDRKNDQFTYQPEIQQGMFILNGQPPKVNETTYFLFKVNLHKYKFENYRQYSSVSQSGAVIKAQFTNPSIFMILTDQNVLQIMQIFPGIVKNINEFKGMSSKRKIIDFDIIDMEYLVLYQNDSTTDVMIIENSIELVHRLRLPLYAQYQNYKYRIYDLLGDSRPKRDFYESTILLVLNDTLSGETGIFIYKIDEPQHNSLFLVNDSMSLPLKEAAHAWVTLTGDPDDFTSHFVGLVTEKRFMLFEIRYYDQLSINLSKNQELIDKCKNQFVKRTVMGVEHDTIDVQHIELTPYSELLPIKEKQDQMMQKANIKLNLTIKSSNHGLAIVPADDEVVNITYQLDKHNPQKNLSIMVGGLISGYSLDFDSTCSYVDSSGKTKSCTKYLNPKQYTSNFSFPIASVTSERQIIYAFPIDQYFFAIDCIDGIQIMRFPDGYDDNLYESEKPPMIQVDSYQQMSVLNCSVNSTDQFVKLITINSTEFYQDRKIYLLFFQCWLTGNQRSLGAIEINVMDPSKSTGCNMQSARRTGCIRINPIRVPEKLVYKIIDVDLGNLTLRLPQGYDQAMDKAKNSSLEYSGTLAVVCEIKESYSNILLIYDMIINQTLDAQGQFFKYFQKMTQQQWVSAAKRTWDTFKVNGVFAIPDTKFLAVSIDGYGALIYHTGLQEIVYQVDIELSNKFKHQLEQKFEEVKVFGVSIGNPDLLFIFTNQGIYVYGFKIPLCCESQFLNDPALNAPQFIRVLRVPFLIENLKIVTSPYGYSCLFYSPIGRGYYQVKVMIFTYFQDIQSKFYRLVDLDINAECLSFQRSTALEYTTEDQLGVTMICNQRFRAVRFCLRPHVEVDLNLTQQSTLKNGPLGFNEFELTVTGYNNFTIGEVNRVSVPVKIQFAVKPTQRTDIITFVVIFLLVAVIMALFLRLRSKVSKRDKQEERQQMVEKYTEYVTRSQTIFKRRSTMFEGMLLKNRISSVFQTANFRHDKTITAYNQGSLQESQDQGLSLEPQSYSVVQPREPQRRATGGYDIQTWDNEDDYLSSSKGEKDAIGAYIINKPQGIDKRKYKQQQRKSVEKDRDRLFQSFHSSEEEEEDDDDDDDDDDE